MNYIDLYQLHRPSEEVQVPIDETLRALDDLIRASKVRYIGNSNFYSWEVMETLWFSEKMNFKHKSEQRGYALFDQLIEREMIPMAQKHRITILSFSPLGGGILTGKYKRNIPFPDDSRSIFDKWEHYWAPDLTDGVFDLLDLLSEITGEKWSTISQPALAWIVFKWASFNTFTLISGNPFCISSRIDPAASGVIKMFRISRLAKYLIDWRLRYSYWLRIEVNGYSKGFCGFKTSWTLLRSGKILMMVPSSFSMSEIAVSRALDSPFNSKISF